MAHARDGHRGDRAGAEHPQAGAGAAHLPLPAGLGDQRLPGPRLGHRHHLHPAAKGMDVPGGRAGLVLALHRGLGAGPDPGAALRAAGGAASPGGGHPGDLEQRPGQPLHQPGTPWVLHRTPGGGGGADQHEPQGPDPGLLQPRATAPASPLHPADTAYTPW